MQRGGAKLRVPLTVRGAKLIDVLLQELGEVGANVRARFVCHGDSAGVSFPETRSKRAGFVCRSRRRGSDSGGGAIEVAIARVEMCGWGQAWAGSVDGSGRGASGKRGVSEG